MHTYIHTYIPEDLAGVCSTPGLLARVAARALVGMPEADLLVALLLLKGTMALLEDAVV